MQKCVPDLVEQLSDPNQPMEVARRYDDLFQKTYSVAEVLEDSVIDEDDINHFIVEMLIVCRRLNTLIYLQNRSTCVFS